MLTRLQSLRDPFRTHYLQYLPLIVSVLLYIGATAAYIFTHDKWSIVRIGLYSPLASIFLILLLLAAVWWYVYLVLSAMLGERQGAFQHAWRQWRNTVTLPRVVGLVLPVILISVFNSLYTSFKATIGHTVPYRFDALLAELDRSLHGGIDPWRITHELVPTTAATQIIDLFYTAWFFIMWGFLFWQVLRLNRPVQRQQLILSYVLSWSIVGSLFAYLLASAGPCYYGMVTDGPDVFAPLMERLQQMKAELLSYGDWRDLGALNGQEYLRRGYLAGEVVAGGGISAMPSMHVSMATLFMLSAWQVNRLFGWIMLGYLLVILFGSVHLGWHYAVDGYLSVLLTIIIWLFAGWVVRLSQP